MLAMLALLLARERLGKIWARCVPYLGTRGVSEARLWCFGLAKAGIIHVKYTCFGKSSFVTDAGVQKIHTDPYAEASPRGGRGRERGCRL